FKSSSVSPQDKEIRSMPLCCLVPRTCLVVELDAGRLIVQFQHIIVTLHRVHPPQLNMLAFKLDGATHFHAGIPPAHVGSSTSHLPGRLRGANTLNGGFCRRLNLVALAPGAKCFIREHTFGLVSSLCVAEASWNLTRYHRGCSQRRVYQRLMKKTSF